MKAPFPYFGGKSRVAEEVWTRFGDVPNYVEPFCGSAAVVLNRPHEPRIETVNDINCFIANFWRAIQADPEGVAHHANWPVNEADLHARHRGLMLSEGAAEWRERMKTDPEYYDVRVAGWWVWGASCWIGAGWCDGGRLFGRDGGASNKFPEVATSRGVATATMRAQIPDLAGDSGAAGRGIHSSALHKKMPNLQAGRGGGSGLHQKIPGIGRGGQKGVTKPSLSQQVPHLTGGGKASTAERTGGGFDAAPSNKIPHLSGGGRELTRQLPHVAGGGEALPVRPIGGVFDDTGAAILAWFTELQRRLRRVRVVCGDWARVVTPAVTTGIGLTAIFLDPPYADTAQRTEGIYSHDDLRIAHDVREWAIANGDNPNLRIALCGYDGEHQMPPEWDCFAWQAQGGYANQKKSGTGFENRKRERIWFSPHCLPATQASLFEASA